MIYSYSCWVPLDETGDAVKNTRQVRCRFSVR